MTEIIEWARTGWTPGGVGIWVFWATALLGWWKGLPAVLDAFANRQSKIEERMGKLLEDATARFQRELAAADQRHEDCMAGQEKLIERIGRLEDKVQEQQDEIEELQRKNEGLIRQRLQQQVSALRTDGQTLTPTIEAAIRALDKLPGVGE